jgi:hypothetical protein
MQPKKLPSKVSRALNSWAARFVSIRLSLAEAPHVVAAVAVAVATAVVVAATAAAVVAVATAAAVVVIAPLVPVVGKIAVMAPETVLLPKAAMPMTKAVVVVVAPLVAVVLVPVVVTISLVTGELRVNRPFSLFA